MATQKVKPDPDALEPQDRRQQRRQRYRKVGTYALVAIVVAVVAAAAFALWSSRTPDAVTGGQPSASVPAVAPTESPNTETAPSVGRGKVDYLLDLKTRETTPLPKRIRSRGTNGYAISPDGPDGTEVALYGRPSDATRADEKQLFVANLDGTHLRQITHDGWAEQPAWSPDGTQIAYIGQRPAGEAHSNIFVVDLTSRVTTQVTFEFKGVSDPQFSPDGSSIVYTAIHPHYDEVRIVPATGGKGRKLVDGRGFSMSGASFSPDGSLLSYVCDGDLCLANADGSNRRVRSLTDAECLLFLHSDIEPCVLVAGTSLFGINAASWSPDGSRLTYMDYGPETVDVIDVTTGERTRVASGAWPRWVDDRTLIVEVCSCPH